VVREVSHGVAPDVAAEGWSPLVAVDEVSVSVETRTLERTVLGARVTALLRWDYRDRAASPTAWDAGVRAAFGTMQFDCGHRALRTRTWTPVDARGERVAALAFRADEASDAEEWVRPREGTMGARLVAAVCRAPGADAAGATAAR
jgi:hypothetical protein